MTGHTPWNELKHKKAPATEPDQTKIHAKPRLRPSGQPFEPAINLSEPSALTRAQSSPHPKTPAKPTQDPDAGLLLTIVTVGELLDDLQANRVANGNRIAALERTLGGRFPHLDELQTNLKALEHAAELELKRAWRRHPLAPWATGYHGVGEKSIARLVAIIGDPGERQTVSQLWAYCGHGAPAKRRRGMTEEEAHALGNPRAKKQTWLIATSLLKAGNREHYDQMREHYSDRVHDKPCVRCGPSGHPAPEGSPWSAAHQHAAALRYTGKMFLKDLWLASRQLHTDTHVMFEGGES